MKRHEDAVHHNIKAFSCKHCNKTYSEKGKLIIHERIHTNDELLKCEDCDKKFTEQRLVCPHLLSTV